MGMRGAALIARFALSIYLIRYLGIAELGIFGLVSGIAGVMPAVLGLGVNYFMNREIIALAPIVAYRRVRDRLALTLAMSALGWAVGLTLLALGALAEQPHALLIGAIVTLEYWAIELHLAIVNRRRPVTANLLLFVRSASWIAPAAVFGIVFPALRTIGFVLDCWLAALVANFALLAWLLRRISWRDVFAGRLDLPWIVGRVRRAPLIYLNDLGVIGQTYLDRFIVFWLLGAAATGLYTLIFQVINGLYVLVHVSVIQLALARLHDARAAGGSAGWRDALWSEARRAGTLATGLAVVAAGGVTLVLPFAGFDQFVRNLPLLALMSAGTVCKAVSDLLNVGLYSLERDRAVALVNVGGIALSALFSLVFIRLFGLVGVGLSALATPLLIGFVRVRLIATDAEVSGQPALHTARDMRS